MMRPESPDEYADYDHVDDLNALADSEGFDVAPLVAQYARWRRKAAILIWFALAVVIVGTVIITALSDPSTSATLAPTLTP